MTDRLAPPPHWSPDEFRRNGHALVDWLAAFYERLDELPVQSTARPGDIRRLLPARPPVAAEPFDHVLADLDHVVVPGVTNWQSPGFYAYFPSNASPPSVLGELLSAGLGVQGMLWSTSPACTEMESHVLDWLLELCGLPDRFRSAGPGGGVIQDSASSAALCALLAARERARQAAGVSPEQLVAYCSTQTHSSVEKGARVAAFGHIRQIDVDEVLALRPEALAEAIRLDRAAGLVPAFVCTTIGSTSTTAVDPVAAVAELATAEGIWHHVDAAFAGAAMVCPEQRHHLAGVDRADSYCFNPHKWLLTNFDCTAFWVADRSALVGALGILPEYLRNAATASGEVIDYRDWQVPLGRRFRALKLWFVLRTYGQEGLRAHIRSHLAMADELADRLEADPRFELVAPHPFSLVCFRLRAGEAATEQLLTALNATGRVFCTHTRVAGSYTIRVAVGAVHTTWDHLDELWDLIDQLA